MEREVPLLEPVRAMEQRGLTERLTYIHDPSAWHGWFVHSCALRSIKLHVGVIPVRVRQCAKRLLAIICEPILCGVALPEVSVDQSVLPVETLASPDVLGSRIDK